MAHHTDNRDHERPLTAKDVDALAFAVRFTTQCLPPATRNLGLMNPAIRGHHDKLRTARLALKKIRELKGQGL